MTQRYDPQVEEARLRYPKALKGLSDGEIRILLARVTPATSAKAVPALLADGAQSIRKNRAEPTGSAYENGLARRGGREFTGGPVCWDPATDCDGAICRDCPTQENS